MTGQQLKSAILQMAVQGKLVPQNPEDEPASVLVEKIREEKEKLIKFYENNHFKLFGKRKLDRDETDIKGGYLLQYFAIL